MGNITCENLEGGKIITTHLPVNGVLTGDTRGVFKGDRLVAIRASVRHVSRCHYTEKKNYI
jgi:hypothetical protein